MATVAPAAEAVVQARLRTTPGHQGGGALTQNPLDEFRERFRLAELALQEYRYWVVSLRPQQPTVGAMVVSLRRPCTNLGDLEPPEATELATVFSELERALAATYRPSRCNYLALMMVDPQVHLHVVPRYEDARDVAGRPFVDAAWPGPPDIMAALPLDSEGLDEIAGALQTALG